MRILSMSGFVPEQVCDTIRFTQYIGERNIAHYCGYASDYISRVLQDKSIDGAVYPKSCDSTRIMTSYLSDSGKFLHQIGVPPSGAVGYIDYFANEIKRYKKAVETYYSITIGDIRDRTDMVNRRNELIRKTYANISDLSFSNYLRAVHNMLELPLVEQQWNYNEKCSKSLGKKVFLVGSFLSNINIIDVIERSGMSIVGDTLPESGRLISQKSVDVSGDIYKELAKSILTARLSPTQNHFKCIMATDFEEMENKQVDGIIFLTQKYCEAYDYLYNVYKMEADLRGIPIILLSMDNTRDEGKASLVLEAFAETL